MNIVTAVVKVVLYLKRAVVPFTEFSRRAAYVLWSVKSLAASETLFSTDRKICGQEHHPEASLKKSKVMMVGSGPLYLN